jgi:hypothetical protein
MGWRGVQWLDVSCWLCHHRAIPSAYRSRRPSSALRMVCTDCGMAGTDARPNLKEQPPR